MNKLAVAAWVLGAVACSKTSQEASKAPRDPAQAPTAAAAAAPSTPAPEVAEPTTAPTRDVAKLPPAGATPTPVTVARKLDPIWNAPIKTLTGEPTSLAGYRGKALMLVNVASRCGLTPQYSTLEALQKKYASKGFTVVGFPSNQFGDQEPGTAEEIRTFCATNYGITFPIMEKIDVNGDTAHPIFKALTPIADVTGKVGPIRWNFEKFVVSADGTRVTRFSPMVVPEDPSVIAAVEAALPR